MRVGQDLARCWVNWLQRRLEVMQWEAPERALRGSNWRQNKLRCCSIPSPTHCSLTRTQSRHNPVISAGGCVLYTCALREHLCARGSHWSQPSLTPLVILFTALSFIPSIPPTLFWSFVSFTYKKTCARLSAHIHSWHGWVPNQQHAFGMGLCKKKRKIQKSVRHNRLMVSPWQLREQGPAMRCQANPSYKKNCIVVTEDHLGHITNPSPFWYTSLQSSKH